MAEELAASEPENQRSFPLILVKRGTKKKGERAGALCRGAAIFASPYYEDPFHPDLPAAGFLEAVWGEISLSLPGGKVEGRRRKCWGQKYRK